MLFAGNIGDHPSFGIFSTHLSGTLSTFWAYLCVIGPLHVAVTVVGWYLAASDASPDRLYPTSSLSSDDISSTSGRSQRLFSRCSTTNNNRATLSLTLFLSLSLSLSLLYRVLPTTLIVSLEWPRGYRNFSCFDRFPIRCQVRALSKANWMKTNFPR